MRQNVLDPSHPPMMPQASDSKPNQEAASDSAGPDASLLEDKLPRYLQATRSAVWLTSAMGIVYWICNWIPIWHTDIWGHISYGRWIVEQGSLPRTEPLLVLARGMPYVDTAWASKLLFYFAFEQFGITAISALHGLFAALFFAAVARACYQRTHQTGWTLLGLGILALIDFYQLTIVRPQLIGMVCFAALFAVVTRPTWKNSAWWQVPLIFALWSNFHGSFFVGFALLAGAALGKALDLLWRTRSLRAAVRGRTVWRPVLLLQLAAIGALINPSGLGIYPDVLTIASNPNLEKLIEWAPLNLTMIQGQLFALVALMLAALYRWTPRRVSFVELVLLIGFGGLSLWTLRMIVWFGPIAAWAVALHAAAIARKYGTGIKEPAPRKGLWSVAVVGLSWIFFAYTPFGLQLLHRSQAQAHAEETFRRRLSDNTPLAAVEYIRAEDKNLPEGLLYNSHEWGDFLQWAGIGNRPVFVNSHVHLIPEDVWRDYLHILTASAGWDDKLDRYGVNSLLLDMRSGNYDSLIRALRNHDDWREVYRGNDGLAVLFVRKHPIGQKLPTAGEQATDPH